jgi:regulator of replication initiation timing
MKEDRSLWEKKMQQMLEEMHTLKEEKEPSVREVLKLETNWAELRSQLVEPQPPQPTARSPEAKQKLQVEAQQLQKGVGEHGRTATGPSLGERKADSPEP